MLCSSDFREVDHKKREENVLVTAEGDVEDENVIVKVVSAVR